MKLTRYLTTTIAATILAGAFIATTISPPAAQARVFLSVGIAPPLIPVYAQPIAPGYGYIWTPGYWAYGDEGYYWVDGAWVEPPYEGALWTPGYWGWGDGAYCWYPGYWGLTVGYYGGINYGFGYFGTGFYGGYWRGGHLFYNGAYNHLGFHDGFVYNQRVSGFDGRPGGSAFARNEGSGLSRSASINGSNFTGNRGAAQVNDRGGFGANGARPAYNGGAQLAQARSSYAGNSFAQNRGAPQSYAAPQARSYAGGSSYSAPQARSSSGGYSGGASHASYSGGGSHGGGGGHR